MHIAVIYTLSITNLKDFWLNKNNLLHHAYIFQLSLDYYVQEGIEYTLNLSQPPEDELQNYA